MRNFAIFFNFFKKSLFLTMRGLHAKKRAFCVRVGPKMRAAENTKNKWNQGFQDMGFFFSARRVRSSLTMKNTARYRSAGPCPPHSRNPTKTSAAPRLRTLFKRSSPSRDRPSPYGEEDCDKPARWPVSPGPRPTCRVRRTLMQRH